MASPLPSGRLHAVVVEPDEAAREALAALLTAAGFACHLFDGGDSALISLRNLVPNIIVSRLLMRGVDGLQLCRNVRDRRLLDGVPVIVLDDPPDPGAAAAARTLFGVHVVSSVDEVVATARRLTRGSSGSRCDRSA